MTAPTCGSRSSPAGKPVDFDKGEACREKVGADIDKKGGASACHLPARAVVSRRVFPRRIAAQNACFAAFGATNRVFKNFPATLYRLADPAKDPQVACCLRLAGDRPAEYISNRLVTAARRRRGRRHRICVDNRKWLSPTPEHTPATSRTTLSGTAVILLNWRMLCHLRQ